MVSLCFAVLVTTLIIQRGSSHRRLAAVPRTTSSNPGTRSWMSAPAVQRKTLFELALPASHNAQSYKTNGLAQNTLLENAICCQSLSIRAQLEVGIRALDVRVNKEAGTVTAKHGGWRCVGLKEVLQQIFNFLRQQPTEVVCLRIKQDKLLNSKTVQKACYGSTDPWKLKAAVIALMRNVQTYNVGYAAELSKARGKTIGDLVRGNTRLVLMFSGLDPIDGTYKQTVAGDSTKLLKKVRECSKTRYNEPDTGKLRWLCMQVTAARKALWSGYASTSENVAEKAREPFTLERIMVSRKESKNKLFNFIGMDFVGASDSSKVLLKKIIWINQQQKPPRNPYEKAGYVNCPDGCALALGEPIANDTKLWQTERYVECSKCLGNIMIPRSFSLVSQHGEYCSECHRGKYACITPDWIIDTKPQSSGTNSTLAWVKVKTTKSLSEGFEMLKALF